MANRGIKNIFEHIRRFLSAGLVVFALSLAGTARAITLDEVISQAVARSYDLQIAQKDIDISKSDLKITRSEYLPTIQRKMEYTRQGVLAAQASYIMLS